MKSNMRLFSTVVVALVISLTSLSVQAQQINRANQEFPALVGINLTPQQETQIKLIRKDTRAQIESILSPEQKNQARASLEQGNSLKTAISSLNLSPEQRTRIEDVLRSTRQKVQAVLTLEQKQQIRQKKMMMRIRG